MYKTQKGFYEPASGDCKVWRYTNFEKFFDLLDCRSEKTGLGNPQIKDINHNTAQTNN